MMRICAKLKFRLPNLPRSKRCAVLARTTPAPSMPSRCSRSRSHRARSRRPIWAACSRSWPAPKNERDLSEIRAELEAGGYVRPADRRKQVKQQPSKPMHFRSSDGFRYFCRPQQPPERPAVAQDARRDDLWLHAEISRHARYHRVRRHPPPDETITEAAELCGLLPEARGQNVPSVDVTPVRFLLRKPNGGQSPAWSCMTATARCSSPQTQLLPRRLRVE